jgi:3-keto-5-aminohexanoate cleavage enzyme
MTPVVVEAAINGGSTKARNPHTPIAPEEIAADALECLAAGATIVHNHVETVMVPGAEAAARYLEGWTPVLAERPDALLYPTTNFGPGIEGAYAHLEPLAATGHLRIGVLDPGSVNLGAIGPDGVPGGGIVYTNDFAAVRHMRDLCARLRLGPSVAIFEPGFLRTALRYERAGLMPPGALVKLYFGGHPDTGTGSAAFGLPPTRAGLDAYCELLAGSALPWSVAVVGGDLFEHREFALEALRRGAHLHVGLEDHVGTRTPTNADLVAEAVDLCAEAGRPVATAAETVRILGLPDPPPSM